MMHQSTSKSWYPLIERAACGVESRFQGNGGPDASNFTRYPEYVTCQKCKEATE